MKECPRCHKPFEPWQGFWRCVECGGSYGFQVAHGKDCEKAAHRGEGYLHAADDDTPYDVDGFWYCGRCHTLMPTEQLTDGRRHQFHHQPGVRND